MAPLRDSVIAKAFCEALENWNRVGYVRLLRVPNEWLRDHLPGETAQSLVRMMYEHLLVGGEIDQVIETRDPWWNTHDFHYDFRFAIARRKIYVETVIDLGRMGPTVTIVNIHNE